jgi:hypothetical protein
VRFPRLQPGQRLTAELVNAMLDAIERLENMTADPSSGIELIRSAGGIALRLSDVGDDATGGKVVLKVTSTDPDDLEDGLYPAVIETCEDPDGDPPTWSDGDPCWAADPNGGKLLEQRYNGTNIGTHGDGSPVFSVEGLGAGSSAVVQVTSTDTVDDLYPATIQDWTDGTVPGFTPGDPCWAEGPNGEDLTVQNYNAVLLGMREDDGLPVFSVSGTVDGGCDDDGGGGNSVQVVTGFNMSTCQATLKNLSATVTVCGVQYGIEFDET